MGNENRLRSWELYIRGRFRKMMKCIYSREQLGVDDIIPSSESLATRDYSASGYSSRAGDTEVKPDSSNIEEAESSLRESGFLNYEEARALLGRLEYQKGNMEAALTVFEGIDIAGVTSRMKESFARRSELNRRLSQGHAAPLMSMHAISLLFEAIFLKAKSLQSLGRFEEAALSCKVILDTIESGLPEGLPVNFAAECKLQEILRNGVELLPQLWILAEAPQDAFFSFRRALLYSWNLDSETSSRIEKEFAIFLLYSGCDASPPNLRCQMEGSFVPRNNVEEAILLLLIVLRKFVHGKIEWDPSVIDHLSFALSISGSLTALAHQVEELLPGVIDSRDKHHTLALCYYGEGENINALNLLRNSLKIREHANSALDLLLASKICTDSKDCHREGINYVHRAIPKLQGRCDQMLSVAHCLLGRLLSTQSRLVASDSQRISIQAEALFSLEIAEKIMIEKDPNVIFHLSLENAEQRKLDSALYYAKQLLKVEAGTSSAGWVLLARILSAKKRFVDAEAVINAALDQTGRWEQGQLIRTKARLQIAQGQLKRAVETYTHLLAILQVEKKNSGSGKNPPKSRKRHNSTLEMETWHDLAEVYTSLSQWRDAEVCLVRSSAISPHSASRCHITGLLCEAKGLHKEALRHYNEALDIDPDHSASLVSTAMVLRQVGDESALPVIRSFLTDALRLDRTNSSAWYNLGLLYKVDNGIGSLEEAVECFEAAAFLQETAPVEPFC